MKDQYVTLFDNVFLPQVLALHRSMERHLAGYELWALCVDCMAFDILSRLSLPNVRLLNLAALETADLLRVKAGRTPREYCWTLTPFAPRFVFEADPAVEQVTYVDADLWFCNGAEPLLNELAQSGRSVLITRHDFAPEYDQFASAGRYCVQFMTFRRVGGEVIRRWWEERCIDWCYDRSEDGKFGDQKYLDDWTERFSGDVHVLECGGLALAPWNAVRYPASDAVFFHFHGFRVRRAAFGYWRFRFGSYEIPNQTKQLIHRQYLKDIVAACELLTQNGFSVKSQEEVRFDCRHMFGRVYGRFCGVCARAWDILSNGSVWVRQR